MRGNHVSSLSWIDGWWCVILTPVKSLYHDMAHTHDVSTSYVVQALDTEELCQVLPGYCEFRCSILRTGILLHKCPLVWWVWDEDLHLVWTTITWPDHNLWDETELTLVKGEVEIRRESLVYRFIITKHILNYVIWLVYGVPLGVLVDPLYFDWQGICIFCHLSYSLEVLCQLRDHLWKLLIFVTQCMH